MAGKRGLGWMGTGTLAFVGVFGFHGCLVNPPCGCSPVYEEIEVAVRDEDGPVDSASIVVYRWDDGALIDSGLVNRWYPDNDDYPVFGESDKHYFGEGKTDLDIRVIARKGGKSADVKLGLRMDAGYMHLRKVSGPDTLFLR